MDTDVWNKKSRRQFGRLPSHSPSWRRRHFDNCQMFFPPFWSLVAPSVSRLDVHGNNPRHFLPFGNTKNNKKETHICQQCVYARVCVQSPYVLVSKDASVLPPTGSPSPAGGFLQFTDSERRKTTNNKIKQNPLQNPILLAIINSIMISC